MVRQDTRSAWGFIAFPVAIIFIFTALPTVVGIALSFFSWSGSGAPRFVGLQNYLDLIASGPFLPALRNTLLIALITVPATVVGAFLLAVAMHAAWFRGRIIARTIYFIPTIISIVAIGFIWRWMLDRSDQGLMNQMLSGVLPMLYDETGPEWLGNSPLGLASIMFVTIWRNLGFCVVLYLASLGSVPRSLYEAAALDGTSSWQAMWQITWPSVRPMTWFLLITGMIGALQVFDLVLVMIGLVHQEWTDVLNLYLYREFTRDRLGFAAAIGVVVLLISAVFTLAQIGWLARGERRGLA